MERFQRAIFASVKNLIRLFLRVALEKEKCAIRRFVRRNIKRGSRDGFPFLYIHPARAVRILL